MLRKTSPTARRQRKRAPTKLNCQEDVHPSADRHGPWDPAPGFDASPLKRDPAPQPSRTLTILNRPDPSPDRPQKGDILSEPPPLQHETGPFGPGLQTSLRLADHTSLCVVI